MSIALYKPTKKVTGLAISLQSSDKDKSLYLNLIKQFSWDENARKGSFFENRNKPGMSTIIKLNQVEGGSILDAIENNSAFSAYHNSANRSTQIIFEPSKEKSCFTLKILQTENGDENQKNSFFIPISFGEARLIKKYLIPYLHKSLRKLETPKNRAATQQKQLEPEPTPAKEESNEPSLEDFEPTNVVTETEGEAAKW